MEAGKCPYQGRGKHALDAMAVPFLPRSDPIDEWCSMIYSAASLACPSAKGTCFTTGPWLLPPLIQARRRSCQGVGMVQALWTPCSSPPVFVYTHSPAAVSEGADAKGSRPQGSKAHTVSYRPGAGESHSERLLLNGGDPLGAGVSLMSLRRFLGSIPQLTHRQSPNPTDLCASNFLTS
jgi:hypothetical protein